MAEITITVQVGDTAAASWTIPETAWSRVREYLDGFAAQHWQGATVEQSVPPATLQGAADVLRDDIQKLLRESEFRWRSRRAADDARAAVSVLED